MTHDRCTNPGCVICLVDRHLTDDVTDTRNAIQQLDLLQVDYDGPLGSLTRGLVLRAIGHLERSLQVHLTGPHTPTTSARRPPNWQPYEMTAPRPGFTRQGDA